MSSSAAGHKRPRQDATTNIQVCNKQEEERLLNLLKTLSRTTHLVRPVYNNKNERLHLMETCLVVLEVHNDLTSSILQLCRKRQVPYLLVTSLAALRTTVVAISNQIEEHEIKPFLQLAETKSDELSYTVWRYTRSKIYANLLCCGPVQDRVLTVLSKYNNDCTTGLDQVTLCVQNKQAKVVVFASNLWMESLMDVLTVAFQCSQTGIPCFLLQKTRTPNAVGVTQELAKSDAAELERLLQLAIQKSMPPLPPKSTITKSHDDDGDIFQDADEESVSAVAQEASQDVDESLLVPPAAKRTKAADPVQQEQKQQHDSVQQAQKKEHSAEDTGEMQRNKVSTELSVQTQHFASSMPQAQRQLLVEEDADELTQQQQQQSLERNELCDSQEEKEIRKLLGFYSLGCVDDEDGAVRPLAPDVPNWHFNLHLLNTSLVVIVSPDVVVESKGKKKSVSFVRKVLEACREQKIPYLLLNSPVGDIMSRKSTPGAAIWRVRPLHEPQLIRFLHLAKAKSHGFFSDPESNWRRAKICSGLICDKKERRRVTNLLKNYHNDMEKSSLHLGFDAVALCIKERRAKLVVFASDLWRNSPTKVLDLVDQCIKDQVCCCLIRSVQVTTMEWSDVAVCLSQIQPEHKADFEEIQKLIAEMRLNSERKYEDTFSADGSQPDASGDIGADTDETATSGDVAKVSKETKKPTSEVVDSLSLIHRQVNVSADEGPQIVNSEILRLEEEVRLLEASLDMLERRKLDVNGALANAQSRRSELDENLSSLHTREQQLHSAQTQQLGLLQELNDSLAKSRGCFARLSNSHTTLSVAEILNLMPSNDEERDDVVVLASKQQTGAGRVRLADSSMKAQGTPNVTGIDEKINRADDRFIASQVSQAEGDTERETPQEEQMAEPRQAESDVTMAEGRQLMKNGTYSHLCLIVDSTKSRDIKPCRLQLVNHQSLDSFWKVADDREDRIATFLPRVEPRPLLQLLLDVSARETLALDRLEPTGRHRREMLWNTCLDLGVIASAVDDLDPGRSEAVTTERMIANVSGIPVVEVDRSGVPTEQKRAIDPNVPLCPYELAGTCADPYCSFQHLDQRPLANVLPREFLPLPRLSLHMQPKSAAESLTVSENLGSVSLPEERPKKRQRTGSSANIEAAATNKDQQGENAAMPDSEDFVVLPPGAIEEGSKKLSTEEQPEFGKEIQDLPSLWWMTEDKTRWVHRPSEAFSVSSFFSTIGFQFTPDMAEISVANGHLPECTVDACPFIGMIIDGIRVSVHAGRFDITEALRTLLAQGRDSWGSDRRNKLVTCFKRIAGKTESLLKKASNSAFVYDAVKEKHTFLVAFDTQLVMGILSFFYSSLYKFQQAAIEINESISAESIHGWMETASYLEGLQDKDALSSGNEFCDAFWTNLFEPTVWKAKRKEKSDSSLGYRAELFRIFHDFQRGLDLRSKVSASSSVRFLIDQIIKPCWATAKKLLLQHRGSEVDELHELSLRATTMIGNIVLGSLEMASNHAQDFAAIASNKSELTELYVGIDKILMDLKRMVSREPLLELILSPLFAANLSLAATLQLYDRVQKRLGYLLGAALDVGKEDDQVVFGRNLYSLSELLWSQLVQLKATLPLYPGHNEASESNRTVESEWDLPDDIVKDHELLVNRISSLEVYANHVNLDNDWNLVHNLSPKSPQEIFVPKGFKTGRLAKKKTREKNMSEGENLPNAELRKQCYGIVSALRNRAKEGCQSISFDLSGMELTLRATHGQPSMVRSAIPRSLLMAGPSLTRLQLSSCKLLSLPYHFGRYFPNLERLELGSNQLKELPDSMSQLLNLEVLSVESNQLQALPSEFALPKLSALHAANNLLKELPPSLSRCIELEVLHLADNPLTPGYWSLVAQLPKLREFTPQQ